MTLSLRHILIFILLISNGVLSYAQSPDEQDPPPRWETGVMGGLNNDGYEWDFRGTYFPNQYLGLRVSLGMAGEIKQLEDWGEDDWDTGHHYAVRFKFNPAIVLRTPKLINWKSQEASIRLFTEPGIVLSPGAVGSRHAQYCRWDVKSGINLQLDCYVFSIGYGISNFSLYSGRPDNMNGMPERDNYITHTVFVALSYQF